MPQRQTVKKAEKSVVFHPMSNLLTGVAPQAGLASQNSSPSVRVAQGTAAALQNTQQIVTSGAVSNQAAVVSITGENSRGASYGEGRSVDASFEKKGKDGKMDSARGEPKSKTLNVTA